MIKLQLDRDTYAKHNEMIQWCLDNIGFSAYKLENLDDDCPFYHAQAFGYLVLGFHNDFDAFRFKLQWGGKQIENTNN